ncbi:MAG: ABC transporter ATP-binding protein/permease [Rhodoglobus sp.]
MIHRRLAQIAGTVLGPIVGLAAVGIILSLLHSVFAISLGSVIVTLIRDDGNTVTALVILGAVTGTRAIVIWIREPLTVRVGATVRVALRLRLLSKLITVPSHERDSGRTAATVIDGVEGLDPYYTRYLPQLIVVFVVPLGVVLLVTDYSSTAGVVLAISAACAVLVPRIWDAKLLRDGRQRWDAFAAISSAYVETLQRVPLLRTFGATERISAQLKGDAQQLRITTMKQLRVSLVESFISASAMHLGIIAAMISALYAVTTDNAQAATAVPVLMLARECFRPMQELSANWHAGYLGLTAVDGLDHLLSLQSTIATTGSHSVAARKGTIDVVDVTYRHPKTRRGIRHLTLRIDAGETVAVIGPSGSGKSTLARLLEREIDPLHGSIAIDGVDLRDYTAAARSASVVVVPQDPTFFAWSVLENLRLYAPDATREHIEQVARIAEIHETIVALPGGYETVLAENGEQLSGGQRQRLAIARALLSTAPVLILDEVTSALDSDTERLVMDAIAQTQSRTTIIIAHRESACTHVGRWIELVDGRIAASGQGQPAHLIGSGGAR